VDAGAVHAGDRSVWYLVDPRDDSPYEDAQVMGSPSWVSSFTIRTDVYRPSPSRISSVPPRCRHVPFPGLVKSSCKAFWFLSVVNLLCKEAIDWIPSEKSGCGARKRGGNRFGTGCRPRAVSSFSDVLDTKEIAERGRLIDGIIGEVAKIVSSVGVCHWRFSDLPA
jgi:hypothetical protein